MHSETCILYWINILPKQKTTFVMDLKKKIQTMERSFILRQMKNICGGRDVEAVHTCIMLLTCILFCEEIAH